MSSYYAHYTEELLRVGMQPGELAVYTGTIRDGFRSGPSTCDHSSNAYVYWKDEDIEELDACFRDNVLEASAHEDHYVFLRNESGNFIQQVAGPAKPVVFANIGAEAMRVDTPLGKFLVPAGTMFRLDQNAPLQREKKKVLLTFSGGFESENRLSSALMLDGGRWKPLNICADNQKTQIRDGSFTIQTLTVSRTFGAEATLSDPPLDPDYEIYLRSGIDSGYRVYFDGVGMEDEGLIRARRVFRLESGKIYDFQRLRQAPTTELMQQCTARLPGLEELDGRPGDGQGEETPANGSALRKLLDSLPDSADIPDIE